MFCRVLCCWSFQGRSRYYSVKSIHKNIPNLAGLLDVSQDNVNTLLATSGLASLGNNRNLLFWKNKLWDISLSKHELQDKCELVQCKPTEIPNQHWFIKVGTISYPWNKLTTPGLQIFSRTYLRPLPLNLFPAILTYHVQIGKTEFQIQTFWHSLNAAINGTWMNIPEKISTHSFILAFLCWSNESINFLKPHYLAIFGDQAIACALQQPHFLVSFRTT